MTEPLEVRARPEPGRLSGRLSGWFARRRPGKPLIRLDERGITLFEHGGPVVGRSSIDWDDVGAVVVLRSGFPWSYPELMLFAPIRWVPRNAPEVWPIVMARMPRSELLALFQRNAWGVEDEHVQDAVAVRDFITRWHPEIPIHTRGTGSPEPTP